MSSEQTHALVDQMAWILELVGVAVVIGGAVVATALLAASGLYAWYASGAPKPWMTQEALREARVMAAWAEQTPASGPLVVWVSPSGPAGTLSAALKERTLRAALPPDAPGALWAPPWLLQAVTTSSRPAVTAVASFRVKNIVVPFGVVSGRRPRRPLP